MIRFVAGALAAAAGAVLLLRRRFVAVRVEGPSMEPTLRTGDLVLVRRIPLDRVRRGQVVVVARPAAPGHPRWLVKRVFAIPGDPVPRAGRVPPGSLFVLGDNPDRSYDSRQFGYFGADALIGAVVRRMSAGPAAGAQPGSVARRRETWSAWGSPSSV